MHERGVVVRACNPECLSQWQVDVCEFKGSLAYMVSSGPAGANVTNQTVVVEEARG